MFKIFCQHFLSFQVLILWQYAIHKRGKTHIISSYKWNVFIKLRHFHFFLFQNGHEKKWLKSKDSKIWLFFGNIESLSRGRFEKFWEPTTLVLSVIWGKSSSQVGRSSYTAAKTVPLRYGAASLNQVSLAEIWPDFYIFYMKHTYIRLVSILQNNLTPNSKEGSIYVFWISE